MIRIEERDNQLHDFRLRLFGMPLIAYAAAFLGKSLFNGLESEPKWKLFILMFAVTFVTWEASRQILLFTRKRFPGIKNTQERIFKTYIFYSLNSLAVVSIYIFISIQFGFYKDFKWTASSVILFFCINLVTTYGMGGIYETIYFFRHWKRSTLETEQLKRESLQTQFESLKNQVNPHFLFNSLNSLSSLIEEDTDKAEQFVQEMSQVYRYLLQSSDRPLTPLKSELEFINAYFFLLQTRFGENLKYEIDIPEKFLSYFIPPLTLQLLVENSVKHNVVSLVRPLTIRISVNENNELIVANNLQPKTQAVLSNKVGLNNIIVKYKLLNQPGIIITQSENTFEVKIPLIKEYNEYETIETQIAYNSI